MLVGKKKAARRGERVVMEIELHCKHLLACGRMVFIRYSIT